jgi:hypothetical protein
MGNRLILTISILLFLFTPSLASKTYFLLSPDKAFAIQCNRENTIYEIRSDFNLNGTTVRIPRGCVLRLNGGSVNNGRLFLLSDSKIVGNGEKLSKLVLGVEDKNVENVLIDGVELEGNKVAAKEKNGLAIGIKVYPGGSVNGFTVSNCRIHGFNAGASIRGSNVTIKDNVFYDNGHENTVTGVHDDEVDVCAGYSPTDSNTCNFIITGNRCLSKYVHRNIDCGELLSEDNILISNNICVCMDGTNQKTIGDIRKSQCIMVGYTGLSENDKGVIISNNICKDCSWAAIYVRANNTEKTVSKNGYVALITGNYIENVVKTSGSKFGAGIACELREGSIISNNIIKNCTHGINIGQIFANGYVKVCGNMIDNCEYGVLNDAVAKQVDITNNSITNVGVQGISITETTSTSTISNEKFMSIDDNTITLKGAKSVGLFLYNISATACRVGGNYIHGVSAGTNVGILFSSSSASSSMTISDNYLSGCKVGISRQYGDKANTKAYKMNDNVFTNCSRDVSGL